MPHIEIVPVQDKDYEPVQNLIRFYIYDLSELMGWDFPENGLFGGVDDQPYYWGRVPENLEHHWPDGWRGFGFIIRANGALAGFALVKEMTDGERPVFDMGAFFIMRKYRHQGIGREVAQRIFDQYRGDWQIRQMDGNAPALHFWRGVINDYTQGNFTELHEFFELYGIAGTTQKFNNEVHDSPLIP